MTITPWLTPIVTLALLLQHALQDGVEPRRISLPEPYRTLLSGFLAGLGAALAARAGGDEWPAAVTQGLLAAAPILGVGIGQKAMPLSTSRSSAGPYRTPPSSPSSGDGASSSCGSGPSAPTAPGGLARVGARLRASFELLRHAFLATLPGLMLTLSLGVSALAFGVVGAACVNGKLTPGGEQAIEAGFALVCPFESAIPVVGAGFAAACPGEEAAVKAALDRVTASTVSAGVILATQEAASAIADGGAAPAPFPLFRFENGKAVHCGWASPAAAPALQWALLEPTLPHPDAGSAP